MLYALTLIAPLALLVLMLVMEAVERPLRRDDVGEQLIGFLDSARADEVETYVSEGFASALERYWSRRRAGVLRRRWVVAAHPTRRHRREPASHVSASADATSG